MTGTLTARDERSWIESVIGMAEQVSDQALIELHREVSRLARVAYGRTERYQQNYRAGMAASRSLNA